MTRNRWFVLVAVVAVFLIPVLLRQPKPQVGKAKNAWSDPEALAGPLKTPTGETLTAKGREFVRKRVAELCTDQECKAFDWTVRLGMSKEDVRERLGSPDKRNRTVSASGSKEQWVYEMSSHHTIYLYFDDGVLTSYQDREEAE